MASSPILRPARQATSQLWAQLIGALANYLSPTSRRTAAARHLHRDGLSTFVGSLHMMMRMMLWVVDRSPVGRASP